MVTDLSSTFSENSCIKMVSCRERTNSTAHLCWWSVQLLGCRLDTTWPAWRLKSALKLRVWSQATLMWLSCTTAFRPMSSSLTRLWACVMKVQFVTTASTTCRLAVCLQQTPEHSFCGKPQLQTDLCSQSWLSERLHNQTKQDLHAYVSVLENINCIHCCFRDEQKIILCSSLNVK